MSEAQDAALVGAPKQQAMDSDSESTIGSAFSKHEALLVKQTMRRCLQECMGCEAKSEFKVAPLDWKNIDGGDVNEAAMSEPEYLYALEKSGFCIRCCWRDGRGFTMTVSEGTEKGGTGVVNFVKPCGCPLSIGKGNKQFYCCCLLPKINTETPGGVPLNSKSEYMCDLCLGVPKFKYSENNEAIYVLKPETCCMGCCPKCTCGGKGCSYLPFYFHDPKTMTVMGGYLDEAPQIKKVWGGFKRECCSTADTFALKFPAGIDAKRKAALLGMTFLIDFTWFERQQEQ